MLSRERLNVYFQIDDYFYKLFHIVNIGKEENPEFKFSGFSDLTIHNRNKTFSNNGVMSEDDFDHSFFSKQSELTYHRDGAMMKKTPDHWNKRDIYINPHGTLQTWTPVNEIETIQFLFVINIRRMDIYSPQILETENKKLFNYVCKKCGLFEMNGTYKVLVFIKNKSLNLRQIACSELYTDILCSINNKLDFCVYVQRASYPQPEPYKSKFFNNKIVTPYAMNSVNFFKKDNTNELLKEIFMSLGILYE